MRVWEKDYPAWICFECGVLYGHRPVGVATWHHDTCGVCGTYDSCTEPRDFGHLMPEWKEHIKDPEYIDIKEIEHNPLDGVGPKPSKQWLSQIQIMNDDLAERKEFSVDSYSAFRLVPEVGELVDAVLKLEGLKKIKVSNEYEHNRLLNELRGEIGDVLVLLAQVATHYDIDMQEAYLDTWHKLIEREYHN